MSSGGGDGGAGARQEQEERRKTDLRARIDRLYGIGTDVPGITEDDATRMIQAEDPTFKGAFRPAKEKGPRAAQENAGIAASNAAGATEAAKARTSMAGENTRLADATRGYYTDQLGEKYQTAERKTRFSLARRGLLGGSEDVNQQGEVREDRDMGATRVDDSVRRAVSQLTTSRENERLNAINLVNAGAGDQAVSAAQAGLRNSFENASSQQKADLFGDLFASSADAVSSSNMASQEAALAARYRERLGAFFPNSGRSSSGRVTGSG